MPATDKRTAADVMTVSPRTCSPFSSVLEAVMIFRDADCGAVPIVEDGKPLGILTDRDVALALAEHPDLANRAVADVMTKGVLTVSTTATLSEIETQFSDHGVRRLVVVDPGGQIVGIIAWSDVARYEGDSKMGEVVGDVLEQP